MDSDVDLMKTTDAVLWAKDFMRRFGGLRRFRIDEDLMVTWFASAIMTGHDLALGIKASCGDELEYKIKHGF